MTVQHVEAYLDEHAQILKKGHTIRAWMSSQARDNHASTSEQRQVFAGLFAVLEAAFQDAAVHVGIVSPPIRIENEELPELAFWHYRPEAAGPSFMIVVQRQNETRAWAEEISQQFEHN